MTGAITCTIPVKTNSSHSPGRRYINQNTENYDRGYYPSYADIDDDESDECDRLDLIKKEM